MDMGWSRGNVDWDSPGPGNEQCWFMIAISYQLSAISYQLSAISCQLSAVRISDFMLRAEG